MSIVTKNIYTRWFIGFFSFFILGLILWNTYLLFQTFKEEERVKMEIWAEANNIINELPTGADVDFPFSIMDRNKTIPAILTTRSEERRVGKECRSRSAPDRSI